MHIIAAIHNCFGILQIMKQQTKNKTHHQNSASITKFCQQDFVLKSVVIEGKKEFQVESAFQRYFVTLFDIFKRHQSF